MCALRRDSVSAIAAILIALLFLQTAAVPARAQDENAPPFRIVVLEGEGSINNVKQAVNRGALVQVEDENRNPLTGAAVTFFLPNEGPSGLFPNGSRVLTVFTDEKGLAASRGIRFNNLVGLMRMRVVVSVFSQTASATITQTNVSSAAAVKSSFVPATGAPKVSSGGGSFFSRKALIILAIAGGAAGAGVYFSTRKAAPAANVSVGTPTIGAPTIGAPTIGGPR